MQEKDLISVIVPVYNVESYLSECVNSILNQTYKNFEVILVDDGSTDNSGKICDEFAEKDSRIRILHKENGGISSARNIGVDISKGNYVCFVDSDDIISKNYLGLLYENAVKFNADVSICDFVRFQKSREIMADEKTFSEEIKKDDFLKRIVCSENNTCLVIACNKLIRKDIAKKIMFPMGKWHEDQFYINYLVECSNSFAKTSAQLYFYRQRPDSIMGENYKDDPRHHDIFEALNERNEIYRKICSKKLYRKIQTALYIKKIKRKFKCFIKRLLHL